MTNTGSAKFYRRRLLVTVSQSIMPYDPPVLSKRMERKRWVMLDRSNRKIDLRVIAAYMTVSK